MNPINSTGNKESFKVPNLEVNEAKRGKAELALNALLMLPQPSPTSNDRKNTNHSDFPKVEKRKAGPAHYSRPRRAGNL